MQVNGSHALHLCKTLIQFFLTHVIPLFLKCYCFMLDLTLFKEIPTFIIDLLFCFKPLTVVVIFNYPILENIKTI